MLITQTPLRISFAGGGTDFREFYGRNGGGAVISTAIDKFIYVIIKERFDDRIVVSWSKKEIVDRVDEIQHELVREAMRMTGISRGVEVVTVADIPSDGSGLGSSSSLTVGLLNACHGYQGDPVSAERLAQEACHIELEILKRPMGKQDQYIAAYGNLTEFKFHSDETVTVKKLNVSGEARRRFNESLMLFFTNRTRNSAQILSAQRHNIAQQTETLKMLRAQVSEVEQILLNGHYDQLGGVLHHGWQLKKELASGISDTEIESMYQTALRAGALGGKISGAGGGGFLLLYCEPQNHDRVRQALSGYREMPFNLETDGSKVIFNIRRDTWKM